MTAKPVVAGFVREFGVDALNAPLGGHGMPPILEVVASGSDDVLSLLLDYGCRPDVRDSCGRTPLHLAAEKGQLQPCRLLLTKHGSRLLDLADANGNTPLQSALLFKHYSVARFLIDSSARSNIVNSDRLSPYHMAVFKNMEGFGLHVLLKRSGGIANSSGVAPVLPHLPSRLLAP